MLEFKLFNSESRTLQSLAPLEGAPLRIYTCGPTIYDFAHIGNFRTYVIEDLVRRSLRFFGYPVVQVMNITDVDDKTIRGAVAKGISLEAFVEPYRLAFFEDLATLQIERAEHYPRATDYIPEMIRLIELLLEKGLAYTTSNGVYFSIRHFPAYGRLSHLELQELKTNASGENTADEYDKEHITDFALWKLHDPVRDGSIGWESPFGKGRPGWHIECSAMAMSLLGPKIDLHCGGVDNCFPHHENEIAQSEGCTGELFVRHWLHVEHLLVDHKKMSKSLGNFYTLRDLMDRGYTGREVRYALFSTHYRTQLNFTLQALDAAKASLQRIDALVARLRAVGEGWRGDGGTGQKLAKAEELFQRALAEDLNISSALAVLFDLVRELNSSYDGSLLSLEGAKEALALFKHWDRVLGVLFVEQEEAPSDLLRLLEEREQARREKNFVRSDQIRLEIASRGYVVEDTAQGARLKKK